MKGVKVGTPGRCIPAVPRAPSGGAVASALLAGWVRSPACSSVNPESSAYTTLCEGGWCLYSAPRKFECSKQSPEGGWQGVRTLTLRAPRGEQVHGHPLGRSLPARRAAGTRVRPDALGVFTREDGVSAPDSRAEGEAARQAGVAGASWPSLSSALNVSGLETLCPGQQDAGHRKEPVSFVISSGSLYTEWRDKEA